MNNFGLEEAKQFLHSWGLKDESSSITCSEYDRMLIKAKEVGGEKLVSFIKRIACCSDDEMGIESEIEDYWDDV